MGIVAASVEANGWVLRLDVTGTLGNFASYTLSPDASPRVVLASNHPGFVKSAGTAVAGSLARSLVATKPLRLPVNPASPTVAVIDETDLGGGTFRVRLALSEHIYATDTGLTLAVLAGWRTGEGAASGIAVTNASTIVAPIPIMRWALAQYDVTAGSFRLSLFVASHHPVGFEPVAGVKFTATDGTTTKTVWATALATDNSLGDNLRCYSVIIDPATATALTTGLLRCDAEVYPWLGAMRSTDTAGTRSMTNLRTDGYGADAASPFVIGYDPAGARYSQMWAYVDPVNGTVTAAAGMIATSLAGAKAVAAAARPRNISTAIQAGYLANRTLAAANGQAAQTRSIDGLRLVLAPGTHAHGTTAVTTGIATAEIPVFLIGDPDDANPRANCIFNTTAAPPTLRTTRVRGLNFSVGLGTNSLFGTGTTYLSLDNVAGAGRSGLESNSTAFWSASSAPTSSVNLYAVTRCKWWRHGTSLTSGNIRGGLFRANQHSRQVQALAALKNRLIGDVEDGFVGTTGLSNGVYQPWGNPTVAAVGEDIVLAWNDASFLRARFFVPTQIPAVTAGTPNPSMRRHVVIGNILERIGADTQPLYSMGEDLSATMSYNIIEGNTHVGDRANTFYSDPLPTTIAETNSQLNQAFVNRVANNFYDWLPTKHDSFSDPTTATVRGTSNGYRPQMIEAWSMLYGVGHEANVDTRRGIAASPDFASLQFSGLRSLAGYSAAFAPLFVDDRSILGPSGAGAAGGGDYGLGAGAPALGRVTRANYDTDFNGAARPTTADSGAFERPLLLLSGRAALGTVQARTAAIGSRAVLAGASARPTLRGRAAANSAKARLSGRAALGTVQVRSGAFTARASLAGAASQPGLRSRAAAIGAKARLAGASSRATVATSTGIVLQLPRQPDAALAPPTLHLALSPEIRAGLVISLGAATHPGGH